LLSNKDISLIVRGRLYSSCVRSIVAWKRDLACKKRKWGALQRAEIKMVRWMCGVKVKDRVPSRV